MYCGCIGGAYSGRPSKLKGFMLAGMECVWGAAVGIADVAAGVFA
jgi:hypothetical protein